MTIIEQIKAEIERLKGIGGIVPLDNREQKTGYESALIDMETFLSTLESEKPSDGLEEEYKDYVESDPVYSKLVNRNAGLSIARHFAQWQKQHDAELIEIAYNDGITIGMTKQKEQMMENGNVILAEEDFDAEKEKSMERGYNLCKEQMMKEAVEYEVGMHGEPIKITFDKYVQRAKGIFPGDKVRVIICKKEDEK